MWNMVVWQVHGGAVVEREPINWRTRVWILTRIVNDLLARLHKSKQLSQCLPNHVKENLLGLHSTTEGDNHLK